MGGEASKSGFAYLHVFSPCPTGWSFKPDESIAVARRAVQSNAFPLWECDRGKYYMTENRSPVTIAEFVRGIGKFNKLTDEDIAELFMEEMRRLKKETFKALLLSSKGGVISVETISVGELNSTLVHPREVFSAAVKKSAAAIVFIHNHPSGDPRPSAEDFATTKRLADCGELLGIRVVDHLVIGDGRYVSMRAMGKI